MTDCPRCGKPWKRFYFSCQECGFGPKIEGTIMEKLQSADEFPPTPGERVAKGLIAATMLITDAVDQDVNEPLRTLLADALIAWGELSERMAPRPISEKEWKAAFQRGTNDAEAKR